SPVGPGAAGRLPAGSHRPDRRRCRPGGEGHQRDAGPDGHQRSAAGGGGLPRRPPAHGRRRAGRLTRTEGRDSAGRAWEDAEHDSRARADLAVVAETVPAGPLPDRPVPGGSPSSSWRARHLARRRAGLHGGAYLHGERRAHWEWLEEITRRVGTAGAMVHYRMPPRFPFPVAYDDALEAVRELVDTAVVRSGRWVLSGDSAGAGLALAVAQALRDQSIPLPALLLLTSRWADLTGVRDGDAELRRAARLYTGPIPAEDPRISPVHGDLQGLPPVHLVAGGG